MGETLTHQDPPLPPWADESGPDTELLVVFVHGSLDRSAGMARLARLSARTHRTLRYDRRGYGRRSGHDGPFTVAANAEDLVGLLGERRAVLVGHSFGGNVALAVAEMRPDLVMGVSTFETPLSWLPWWPRNTAGGTAVDADPGTAAETFMVRLIGRKRWDALPERTKDERRREGPALQGELSDLRASVPWNADRINCPVLCGHGTTGSEHHISGAVRLAELLPNARSVAIEGAGHGAPVSHPVPFHDQLVLPQLFGSGTFTETS